jgi:hypothetical protein
LPSICIPSAVEIVGEICFSECSSLQQVTFESGSRLTEIGRESFKKCSSLKSICIPAGVKFIPERCFSECRSLTIVSFEPGSKLTRIDGHAFHDCHSLCSIEIPSQVEILQASVLHGCRALSRLEFELPSGLRQFELPENGARCLWIPDSVETFSGLIPCRDRRHRLIQFGPESRLVQMTLKRPTFRFLCDPIPEWEYGLFVSLPEIVLRRFRLQLEDF